MAMTSPLDEPPADLALGAFSDTPPWDLTGKPLPWRAGVSSLRTATALAVPKLLSRRLFPPGRRVVVTGLRLGWAILAWRLVERRQAAKLGRREISRAGLSRRLRRAFERLGPTYIKLGQILSSGEGVFPPELVVEFKLCRDRVPPEPFKVVREVVEADLGRPLEEVFSYFEPAPIAAASIAQVHAARLASGEEVVVKVQRPQVEPLVRHDIAAMSWLAPLLIGRIPVASLANPRPWWSCSPRRSSRSSTSAWRPTTCWTSQPCWWARAKKPSWSPAPTRSWSPSGSWSWSAWTASAGTTWRGCTRPVSTPRPWYGPS